MSQEYIKKLGASVSECSCEKCKRMCHAPCCGSVEDMEKLIDAGYADRLMFDDLPSTPSGGDILLQPKWYDFKETPITNTLEPIIIYATFDRLAIVYWLVDGWNGPNWYSADEEHYYTDEHILHWMQAPKPPKKLTTTVPT